MRKQKKQGNFMIRASIILNGYISTKKLCCGYIVKRVFFFFLKSNVSSRFYKLNDEMPLLTYTQTNKQYQN